MKTKPPKYPKSYGVKDEFGVLYSADGTKLLKYDNDDLETYSIREGTKIICDDAFLLCLNFKLREVVMPDSVESIGNTALSFSGSLKRVVVPDSVKHIGTNPFCSCRNLKLESRSSRFVIDNGMLIDKQHKKLISYNGDAEEVTIPDGVKTIGQRAFCSKRTIRKVVIPNTVIKIGESAFKDCESLQQVEIPNSVIAISDTAFCNCKSLQRVNIPNSVVSIGWCAFENCFYLQQIYISDSVIKIGDCAFQCCKHLRQITFSNPSIILGADIFGSEDFIFWNEDFDDEKDDPKYDMECDGRCDALQQIFIPEGSKEHFKQMLTEELWDKLFCVKKAIVQPNDEKSGTNGCNNYPF